MSFFRVFLRGVLYAQNVLPFRNSPVKPEGIQPCFNDLFTLYYYGFYSVQGTLTERESFEQFTSSVSWFDLLKSEKITLATSQT